MDDDAGLDDAFKAADDVLYNAVAGIAEVITSEGIVNVDFEDVRTVMAEQGKAMMGTATAKGPDRARNATEQAVRSPLLEGINLAGVRGVVLNITGSRSSLKLRETQEAADIVNQYTHGEATLIFGAVYDDTMGDEIRVTIIATGLGDAQKPIRGLESPQQFNQAQTASKAQHPTQVPPNPWNNIASSDVATGGLPISQGVPNYGGHGERVPTHPQEQQIPAAASVDASRKPAMPAVWQTNSARQSANAQIDALREKGYDTLDIPTFLRNQAD
ncbi:unnamed protein product [Darwinula stevensoni]|uniref:Tubulin/FtsZ 2-layer sandwich domain-containing protein n=1 Tax=Darwinula stevensoni TaxID=69355 RepID=A0A7R9AIK5_9CRUS|nr:unnamed protein product [Darwinula stevensoni]CAG0906058.1 unnamed protein product [Darwinula stevensoni]